MGRQHTKRSNGHSRHNVGVFASTEVGARNSVRNATLHRRDEALHWYTGIRQCKARSIHASCQKAAISLKKSVQNIHWRSNYLDDFAEYVYLASGIEREHHSRFESALQKTAISFASAISSWPIAVL